MATLHRQSWHKRKAQTLASRKKAFALPSTLLLASASAGVVKAPILARRGPVRDTIAPAPDALAVSLLCLKQKQNGEEMWIEWNYILT
jgi:hypothetical protein